MKFSYKNVKNGLGEVQTTYRWWLYVVTPPKAVGDFPQNLQVRVQSTSLPSPEIEDVQVELFKHKLNFNGDVNGAGELDITLIEGEDQGVLEHFLKWINARSSGDGSSDKKKVGHKTSDLQGEVVMELLDQEDNMTASIKLVGVMFKPNIGGELGNDVGARTLTATLSFEQQFWNTKNGAKW
jgi:hypothetical protein